MKQLVSLREANQRFSQYVAAVERGDEIIITRRGKPVAKLVAVRHERKLTPEQEEAFARLLKSARPLGIGRISRDEIYAERLKKIG